MYQFRLRAAATTGAVSLLVGSAMFALPGTANAKTKQAECGGKIEAAPGDKIVATMDSGGSLGGLLTFDLGTVTGSTEVLAGHADDLTAGSLSALSGAVCEVTVTVATTVVEKAPAVGDPLSGAVTQGAKELNETTQDTAGRLNQEDPPPPGPAPEPETPPDGAGDNGKDQGPSGTDEPAGQERSGGVVARSGSGGAPVYPAFGPWTSAAGYSPVGAYGADALQMSGLFAPALGIRDGSEILRYAREFGVPRMDSSAGGKSGQVDQEMINNAGHARALPEASGRGAQPSSLPVQLAVVALALSAAGLVRRWVARSA